MALVKIQHVGIRGMSACVPPTVEENLSIPFYTPEEAEKVIETTGVERKHIVADSGITASDLCLQAAERLLDDADWERDSIDLICNVTQTSDYINHPNVFVIHEKLGLKKECMALDLYHGCPGWVMGLMTASSLLSQGTIRRCLLLDGDNISSMQYAQDRESRPLFGDCGTATLLEYDESAPDLLFESGTNSAEGEALIRRRGGYREPHSVETLRHELAMLKGEEDTSGVEDLMDGMSVFSFGITTPPKSIKRLCEHFGIDMNSVDKLVLHQANLFMVQKIAKKLKVDPDRVPIALREYGNVTSATIPLTIVSQCANDYSKKTMRTVACGFGTGLSWGTVFMETRDLIIPPVIDYTL